MSTAPAALLGGARGPAWPAEVAGLFPPDARKEAGAWLAAAQRDLGLGEVALGSLAAALSARWGRQEAEQLLWRQLAGLELALHSDFYEMVQVDPLARLCGGFVRHRLRQVPDPLYEAASLVQVWCVRLTGLPMTYGYLSAEELDRFAGTVSRFAADELADADDRLRFLRGVARTLHAHVWKHPALLRVPADAPPQEDTVWEEISWQEGQDSLSLYPR